MRTQSFSRPLIHRTRIAPVLAASAAAALILAGCGPGDGADSAPAPTAGALAEETAAEDAGTPAQFNDADVAFLDGMYPHHAQAIEMTDMVDGRTGNPELTALAEQIAAAQQPEMDEMTALLAEWGKPAPSGSGQGHGMGGGRHGGSGHQMTGMMTDEQMDALMAANGPEFDRMWLEMMIEHHEGAVEMSQEVLADGTNPQTREMAQSIIDGQQAEIGRMQEMLQSSS